MNVRELKQKLSEYPDMAPVAIIDLDKSEDNGQTLTNDSFDLVDAKDVKNGGEVKLLAICIGGA